MTNAQHGEDDILENRPVAVKTTLALESSNLGFTCCDWLPNHLSTQNSNLLKKIEYLIGILVIFTSQKVFDMIKILKFRLHISKFKIIFYIVLANIYKYAVH